MRIPIVFVTACACVSITSLAAAGTPRTVAARTSVQSSQTHEVAQWLAGAFSSRAQAQGNPKFHAVELHVRQIWAERSDGPWLYVEQAMADAPTQPYRQRVYRIGTDGEGPVSDVFALPDDGSAFVGAWDAKRPFPDLLPIQLIARAGCTIYLRKHADGAYRGRTLGKDCASERNGARYATSQVTLTAHSLESWDRGFDSQDHQAWGAVEGPYRFDRLPK